MTALGLPFSLVSLRPASFRRLVVERSHDHRFWTVQAVIVAITSAHGIAELTAMHASVVGERVGLQHVLVLLYLFPVVVASLWFGLEGGYLAGLSAIVLAFPNVVIWHRHDFEWVVELSSMVVVLAVGVAVAAPVERESRQRRRVEDTSRRLALVNGIAEMLAEAREPETALGALLDRLVTAVDLDLVTVEVVDPPVSAVRGRADGAAGVTVTFPLGDRASQLGTLTVTSARPLAAEDQELLAAVAHHLALELEHARYQRHERARVEDYARAVLAAQEAERTRIAGDLHDDVAQPLVQLGRGLGALQDAEGVSAEVAGRAAELRDLSLSTLGLVRDFAQNLRPAALNDLGLIPAVAKLARQHGDRGETTVTLTVEGGERRLPAEVEATAFRIVQEALRNVEKHAAASRASVRLVFADDRLQVVVDDDGCGRDGGIPPGLGIEGMRERAELHGGSFRMTAGPLGGTVVEVCLPIGAGRPRILV